MGRRERTSEVNPQRLELENAPQRLEFKNRVVRSNGHITHLDLSHLSLKNELPRELGGLSCLQTLDIRNNNLSGYIPSEIMRLGMEIHPEKNSKLKIILINPKRITNRKSRFFLYFSLFLGYSGIVLGIQDSTCEYECLLNINPATNFFQLFINLKFANFCRCIPNPSHVLTGCFLRFWFKYFLLLA